MPSIYIGVQPNCESGGWVPDGEGLVGKAGAMFTSVEYEIGDAKT